jgi:hypothetical protein
MAGGGGGSQFVGSYACTGTQTQTCDGAHLADGSWSLNALCPQTLTISGSTITTMHATTGLVITWAATDATHATLAAPVGPEPDFANPIGSAGTIHSFTISSGTMALTSTLDVTENGTFQWVHTGGGENCTFARTYSGPPPH